MFGNRLIKSNNAGAACTTDTVQILDGTPLESIATYQLDGAATSIPNNTYPGTFTNPAYVAGEFGQAAEFNGSNSYIDLGSNLGLANNSFSLSLWIANRATTTNSYFIGAGTQANNQGLHVGRRASTGKFTFAFYANDLDSNTSVPTNGTWEHWACTYDATTNSRKIYYNGVLDASDTASADFQSTSNINLGLAPGNMYAYGELDQVRIFNTALSAGAVTSLYNETVATASNSYINAPSCIAYYKMSDATDETGSYDGTPSNVNFNVAGKFGNAGEFNGSSSEIATGITNSVIPVNSDFTISTWINTSVTTSGFIVAEGNWNAWSTAGFGIQLASSNRIELSIANNGGAGGTQVVSSSIPLNTWVHIVATIDIGNFLKLYIDGSEVASTALSSNSRNSVSGGFYLGTTDSSQYYFNGKIDQVRIFNRAITANEVETLYDEVQCIPTIVPTDYFEPVIYTGNGGTQSITSLDFQPDLVWTKQRSSPTRDHLLNDSVRGANKILYSNLTNAEDTAGGSGSAYFNSFDTNGYTVGSSPYYNGSGLDYVAWNWKAGGAAVAAASIDATNATRSANVDAGFSIMKFHTSASTASPPPMNYIEHGLDATPEMVIYKSTSNTGDWRVMHVDNGQKWVELNTTDASAGPFPETIWDNTSTNIGVRSNYAISRDADYIAYAFHSVDGFSKFGSYVGTGASGNTIVTGFEPAFLMVKRTDTSGHSWLIYDNKRDPSNPVGKILYANDGQAENPVGNIMNFLSNGFELITTNTSHNASGATYIFMAFANQF